jgi:hypothetical protein
LRKAGRAPLFVERTKRELATSDARWREILRVADVVSEGQVKDSTWFGTSSIVLRAARIGLVTDAALLEVASSCLHLRARTLRVARREALFRAGRSLGPSQCEMRFSVDSDALRIDVDVQAAVLKRRTGT